MRTMNIFVYGTLMRGFRANSFFPKDAKMLKGRIAGNLYHYAAGYPIVDILKHSRSVPGSMDYAKDMDTLEDLNRIEPECLPFNLSYGRVHGELYMIPCGEAEDTMHRLDRYEGFNDMAEPGSRLYEKTAVPVETEEGIIWAWVYNMEDLPDNTLHIISGNWRDCFYSNRGGLRPDLDKAIEEKRKSTDWLK